MAKTIENYTRMESDTRYYDKYEDGIWYHHTGYDVYINGIWWGEYEDEDGNVEYFN